MSEILRFQPNSIWDDSWVVDGPETTETEASTGDTEPKLAVVPEEPQKKEWS